MSKSQKSQNTLKSTKVLCTEPLKCDEQREEVILTSRKKSNTATSKIRSRKWFVTLWSMSQLTQHYIKSFKEWVIGKEKCPTTGKEHWHVYFESKNQIDFNTLKNKFGNCDIQKAKGKPQQCFDYVTKDGEYETNMKCKRTKPLKLITKLYKWQQEVVDICNTEADDRTVYWYWSKTGAKGKTSLIKYLIVNNNALVVGGRVQDISNSLNNYYEKNKIYPDVVCVNLARDCKNMSYKGIEGIKDGLVVNTKYECSQHVFNSPHVFIFANMAPNYAMLSEDRWKVKDLDLE